MKNNQKITIAFFLLIISALSVSALTYTLQDAGTTQTLEFVRGFDNGKAIAINTTLPSYYLYNGTDWNQISAPTSAQIGTMTSNRSMMDRLGNNLYVAYQNSTRTVIMKYDAITEAWTQYRNLTVINNTGVNALVCVKNDNKCYFGIESLELVYEVAPNYVLTINFSMQTPTTFSRMIRSNRPLMFFQSSTNYDWNGVGLQSRGLSNTPTATYYIDSNHRGLCATGSGSSSGLYQTNTTSPNTFQNDPSTTGCFDLIGIDDIYYWIPSGAGIIPTTAIVQNTKNNLTSSTSISANVTLWSLDYNTVSQKGWVVGLNGTIYAFGAGSATTHSISTIINPNPSIYGQNTILGAIPSHSASHSADVSIDIYNSTGSNVYGAQCTVNDGQLCSTTVSGGTWTNFKTNQNYTVTVSVEWSNGDSETQNTIWVVNANATTSQINYTLESYQTTLNQFSNIVGVSNLNDNRIFAVGSNFTNLQLISVDATTPSNLIVKSKQITPTSSPDYPTSISVGTDRAYIGTNDELYIFNNMSYGDATLATQEGSSYGFALAIDFIYDTNIESENLAWVCRDGTSDDARRFNHTSATFDATINENPCYTIRYDSGLLFIHKGTSGIKVYNSTNQALLSTISGVSSQSSTATHDRLSKRGNYLFALTGQTQITKYDVSDPSNPTEIADCYTNGEVYSVEAVSDEEAIIGVNGQIRVCDFSNDEKFDTGTGKYTSTVLKTYSNSEVPLQIKSIDSSGKITIAENNRIGIYQYSSSSIDVTTNNAPVITNITTPVNSICLNQLLAVTIEATDTDTDEGDFTYDYDCDGVQITKINSFTNPSFYCSYETAGSKTIKAWVDDGNSIVLGAKVITVNNCNATTLNFKVLDGLSVEPVEGVLVNIAGETSTLTNSAGQSTSNVTAGTHTVTFSKIDYQTKTDTYQSNPAIYTVYLEPTNNADGQARNVLTVQVTDIGANELSEVLVSVTDPLTGIATLQSTNSFGEATFLDMSSGLELFVSAGKAGYETQFTNTVIDLGESKTLSIVLFTEGFTNESSGRGCSDYMKGIYLCSPLRFDQLGDYCTINSDCISDKCLNGRCNAFNWTYCDAKGLDRDSRCVLSATTKGSAKSLTKTITENFLYVLVFIFIMMAIIMWKRSNRRS